MSKKTPAVAVALAAFLQNMPKKLIFIIIGLVAIVLLAVAVLGGKNKNQLAIPLPDQAQNPFLSNVSAPNGEDCNKKPEGISRDACFQSKAINEQNATFCKSIKETNPFVSQDACFNLAAHAAKDKSLCASITNQELKKNCNATITK